MRSKLFHAAPPKGEKECPSCGKPMTGIVRTKVIATNEKSVRVAPFPVWYCEECGKEIEE